jgi:ribosomal protein L22
MTPDTPPDREQGTPAEDEQLEVKDSGSTAAEATGASEAAGSTHAAEATEPEAQAPARKPRRARRAAKAQEAATEAVASGDTPETPSPKTPSAEAPAAAKRSRVRKRGAGKQAAEAPAAERDAAAAEQEPADAPAATPKGRSAAKRSEKAAETPAAPASVRAAKPSDGRPRRRVVKAHARYVRTSARKARMVCGHLRGKSVQEARAILAFTPREVARDWSKLLESAVANAESNHELLEDDLIVREAYADEGPTIKRFRPRAMGRATPIRKRTSHLTITLTPTPEPGANKRRG